MAEVEERLGLAIDIGQMATWDWDLPTGEVTWSARHYLLLGYAPDEVTPSFETWLARVHPDDRVETVSLIEEARDAKQTYAHAFRSLHADGEVVWCRARGRFFYDQDGQPYRMIGVMEDVTEQRRSEAALREREADLARVQRIGEVGGLDIDVAHGLRSIRSPEYLRLHGLPEDRREESHADWFARVHPEDRRRAERALFDALESDATSYDGEYRIVRPSDSEVRWIHARADIERDASGKAVRLVGAHTDVTEQKRSTEALLESEERYRSLFETMDQGYSLNEIVRDAEGRVIDIRYLEHNPALERLIGVPASEAIGRLASEVFPGLDPFWIEIVDRVVTTGASEQVEHELSPIGRWYQSKFYPIGGDRCVSLFDDITERKRAEALLRGSEERQTFLLRFSDALRVEPDVDAIAYRAIALLSDQLRLDRCYITYYRPDDDEADFPYQVGNETVPPLPAKVRLSDFPDAYDQVREKTFVIEDDFERRGLSEAERANSEALGTRAMLASTVRRGDGNPLASIAAVSSRPRKWTAGEIALVEEVAERTWAAIERVNAEAALHASEARFRQFAEASAFGLWIRDAEALTMEYVSPAVPAIYGVDPEVFHGDLKRWAALIVPEDRDVALEHIERARQGEPSVHEFRIQRQSDQAFRCIRNTDFPLLDAQGKVERIGGIVEDVTEAKLAVEHQSVLLAELQHRVRNIMAMIRSMAARSADSADDLHAYRALLQGRLMALARVQTLLTREANAGGSLREILQAELVAQAHHGGQFELIGDDIKLSPKAVEVLTLAFHELATNALKYGAFSVPEGRLRVTWAPFEKRGRTWMAIDWRETGAPSRGPVTRRGFGSDLIEGRIPYELGGVGKITIGPRGAECHLKFPLKDGESILETDAPGPVTIFGGTLDMSGAPDLTGRTVLVVEDDYYLAGDTAAALRGAGATVLGPCPSEDAALDLLEAETPTHAVLDLNLGGGGPRFQIAHALQDRGVPFVFLTGYDPDVIPTDLKGIARLEKPIVFRSIVDAIARL